ncbi:TPA: hypothetical protein DIV45_01580 [Patescibacteria group bacterium]|nr:hypothetical protein [Patescibacteria group bacterium]
MASKVDVFLFPKNAIGGEMVLVPHSSTWSLSTNRQEDPTNLYFSPHRGEKREGSEILNSLPTQPPLWQGRNLGGYFPRESNGKYLKP